MCDSLLAISRPPQSHVYTALPTAYRSALSPYSQSAPCYTTRALSATLALVSTAWCSIVTTSKYSCCRFTTRLRRVCAPAVSGNSTSLSLTHAWILHKHLDPPSAEEIQRWCAGREGPMVFQFEDALDVHVFHLVGDLLSTLLWWW